MGLFDRFRDSGSNRVAMLGVAGLPFSLAAGEQDLLPTLSSLMATDRATPIESVLPPDESACWPTLTSGLNPGHTGVYGLLDREVGTYDTYVPQGGDVQVQRVWDYVEAAGGTTTVLNVPVTNPPQKEVGRMAAGPQAPDLDRAAQPAELRRYLSESDYRLDVDAGLGQEGDLSGLVADAHDTLRARFEAFLRYAEADDWDLFVGCITAPDRLNHFVWDSLAGSRPIREDVSAFYETLDSQIAAFRDALGSDVTFVLVGDHGFTSLEYEVNCQRWLEETGWLSWEESPARLSDMSADTQAFAFPHGRFYLNRTDREPTGVVQPADAPDVLARLETDLLNLTGPDGNAVVKTVYRADDLYDGPHLDLAPDLVAVPEPGFDLTTSFDGTGPIFAEGQRVGMHTPDDAPLIVDHPDAELTGASPFSVAPTVLELISVDAGADDFDGSSCV